jgi:hypothetical protein
MTAPYKRQHPADQTGYSLSRIRTLEANRTTLDAEEFQLEGFSCEAGTDPTNYQFSSRCFVTGNLLATCFFVIGSGDGLFGMYTPGTGAQYLIGLPVSTSRYYGFITGVYDQFIPMGYVEASDSVTGFRTPLGLKMSALPFPATGGLAVEAYDPATGTLWGPTYPYTWNGSGDMILGGVFHYPLASSLLDATSTT